MTKATTNQPRSHILWRRVLAIAAIQGAITLTWVIYGLYFPQLLEKMGLSSDLALKILIIENFLAALIEPVFGSLSDRFQQRLGHRFIIISFGVVLASALFISLPAIALFHNPTETSALFFPAMAIAWAAAMAIFRSPALVLLNQTAPQQALPQAASFLTFSNQFVGAFRFMAYGALLRLGPEVAFTIGSVFLLIALGFLRFQHPPHSGFTTTVSTTVTIPWGRAIAAIVCTALGIAWGLRFLSMTLVTIIPRQWGENVVEGGLAAFFVAIALFSFPAGAIATRWGNGKAMTIGAATTALGLILLFLPLNAGATGAILALLAFCFSFVLNGMIPFVLALVPPHRVGLGLGCYFGVFSAAMSLFDLLLTPFNAIAPLAIATMGAGVLIIASISISLTPRYSPVESL
ncbi:MAG: MFS transporter [Spirulinaceae cyanobacterium]